MFTELTELGDIVRAQPAVQHEVTTRLEKSFKKILTKYPQKSNDKLKDLKRENKRLKKLLEESENKYSVVEKYMQLFFNTSDLK